MTGPEPWDLRPFVAWIVDEYEPSLRAGSAAGAYASQPGGDHPELYGVADTACVLHTLDRLRPSEEERRQWAAAFAEFQDRASGHYVERGPATHVELHATAFAVAAMELLDLEPEHPLWFADDYRLPSAVTDFVHGLDWHEWVYLESHRGAGLGAIAANLPGFGSPAWFESYFFALEAHLDAANGMFGDDKPPAGDLDQIGGTFHYAFLYEWAHRRLPHRSARIDAVLALQRDDGTWDPGNPLWLTLDGVYLLTHDVGHTGHRRAEVEAAVARSVAFTADLVLDEHRRAETFARPMGTHALVAAVSLFADAQRFLGAERIVTDRPLQLVLDRRPFI